MSQYENINANFFLAKTKLQQDRLEGSMASNTSVVISYTHIISDYPTKTNKDWN